ncbi:MAG TPA: flagellar basal-body MS-ring/collar protein FliF [Bryobacteraceae bacterium]|nr:flagellar basal-body MS-ring/collar protein FliF [Bryobacteraceae bacterium]
MDQFKRLTGMLSVRQRWTVLVVGILAVAGVYGLTNWQRESNFRPLYNALAPEDASLVIQRLKESSTPFRLSNNGTTVSVPEEKVAELRLEMAGAGVPKSGRIGFEIFDKTNFGMTDFAEHVNYRRALEGELERSVMAVGEIEQARVHISLPQESVFIEARQPAKASVLIKIRPGASLPESAVPAITNLVASAVEGLAPESVSILDMRGNLLNRPKRLGSNTDEASDASLEYRHKVEQDLTAKLDSTLEPLVGAGRFRAAVSAECDMNSGEQSEETFDPTHSVMTTSQKTEDISSPGHVAGGVPGTASNLPPSGPKPAPTSGGTTRKTENIAYQTSRMVKRTTLPQGAIKRLSVSVLIDHEVRWEGAGANMKRVLAPPSPERLKSIHDLITAAVGFNQQRGDQLIVESLPFESTLNLEPPGAAPVATTSKKLTPMEQLKSDPKMMGGLAAIVLVVLVGGFFLIKMMRKGPAKAAVSVQTTLPEPGETNAPDLARLARAAAGGTSDTWARSGLSSGNMPAIEPPRIEVLTNQLRATAQKDADVYAGVLRGWLKEERA